MKKILLVALFSITITCLIITGVLVTQGTSSKTQNLVVVFRYIGRFEVVSTYHGVSDPIITTNIHRIYISRNVDDIWDISFSITKMDDIDAPMYIEIETIDGNLVYRTVLARNEGYLNLDCKIICDVTK